MNTQVNKNTSEILQENNMLLLNIFCKLKEILFKTMRDKMENLNVNARKLDDISVITRLFWGKTRKTKSWTKKENVAIFYD